MSRQDLCRGRRKTRGPIRGSSSARGSGDPRADDMMEFTDATATPSPTPSPSPSIGLEDIFSLQTPVNASTRQRITLLDNGLGFREPNVSRQIYVIFKACFAGAWDTWKKSTFQWDPELDDDIRSLWNDAMKNRYKDWMNNLRKWSAKQAYPDPNNPWDRRDYSQIRLHFPLWMPPRFWIQMIDEVWDKDTWKKNSAINTANRKSEYEGVSSRHTGGTITSGQHRDQMKTQLSRNPTFIELYERTHCTNRKLAPGSSTLPTDPP